MSYPLAGQTHCLATCMIGEPSLYVALRDFGRARTAFDDLPHHPNVNPHADAFIRGRYCCNDPATSDQLPSPHPFAPIVAHLARVGGSCRRS